jgi:hypothetical protein
MSESTIAAIVGAIVTLGSLVVTNLFVIWRMHIRMNHESKVTRAVIEKNTEAVKEAVVKTEDIYSEISKFKKETETNRKEAADKYAEEIAKQQ